MNVDGDGKKELAEQNHCEQEVNNVGDEVAGAGQDLSKEDKQRTSKLAKDVNDGNEGAVPERAVLRIPQQQPQGSVVCWERFLHVRSLKVLLVENDVSTCHIVAALLRNCSYEVIEATNGLQAWKILEDLTNHIDLVLTEVVMPCVSGVALLCKIMSHKTRKNVPVIMMSSHDSIGLVFKCLSRGAVDFLLKPIRKNELKNLWQHVWRRCHSSSGSGSDSGTETQKSIKSKSIEKSGNDTSSNDESIGLNFGDGSDNGSGNQGYCTKQAAEVDSLQAVSPSDQIMKCPAMECQEQEDQLDIAAMARESGIGVPKFPDLQLQDPIDASVKLVGAGENNMTKIDSGKVNETVDKEQLDLNNDTPLGKLKCSTAKLMAGMIVDTASPRMGGREPKALNQSKISEINNRDTSDAKELPSLELDLRGLGGINDVGTTVQGGQSALKHSDLSAFSRYNKASCGNSRSGSPLVKTLSMHKLSHSIGDPPKLCSNWATDSFDTNSNTIGVCAKSVNPKDRLAATSLNALAGFPSIANADMSSNTSSPQVLIHKAIDLETMRVLAQPKGTQQKLEIVHPHRHYDHPKHLVHNMQQQQQQQLPLRHSQDDFSLKEIDAAAAHSGLSSMLTGAKGNARIYRLDENASSSNQGSNGQNGSSAAVNTGGTNIESDDVLAGEGDSGGASGSGNRDRVYQNRSAHREAALTKFHQKRKERCFQKKVQYQSRKRPAEGRPRIRGQFVRRKVHEDTNTISDN
ncbi:two-component response regulator-like APRR3 isoform X2 [Malania oleifera]|uniref:two-component response regulator-like APRR3 isoform X2 n=1 Tax=Malania oleifera TaxID=397392 RepID=UPI0025ADF085|nr:two-component response regulator-like APRR3 isoform X2 [Malania oleifera]